jgi:hypothetical protein
LGRIPNILRRIEWHLNSSIFYCAASPEFDAAAGKVPRFCHRHRFVPSEIQRFTKFYRHLSTNLHVANRGYPFVKSSECTQLIQEGTGALERWNQPPI